MDPCFGSAPLPMVRVGATHSSCYVRWRRRRRRRLAVLGAVAVLGYGASAAQALPPPEVHARPARKQATVVRGPARRARLVTGPGVARDGVVEEFFVRKHAEDRASVDRGVTREDERRKGRSKDKNEERGVGEVTTSDKVEVVMPSEMDAPEDEEDELTVDLSPDLSVDLDQEQRLREMPWRVLAANRLRRTMRGLASALRYTRSRLQSVAGDVEQDDETVRFRFPTQRQTLVWLWEVSIVVGLLLLLRAGVSRTLRWIHSRLDPNRDTLPYEQSVFECMQRPLEFLSVFTVGTSLAEAVSRPLAATGLLRYIRATRELGVIFAATWFVLRWIERIRSRFVADIRVDKAQVDTISRVATVVAASISVLISFDTLGINIQTVLAFGGIGGVAIGFAGREIISNFFSGFMIYVTRPFTVGEWIRSIENEDLDGTVEEIGWYLTRVRKWDKRPLYIPNSRFSTLIVETPSRMTNRRVKHTVHLRMEDLAVIRAILKDLEATLMRNQDLDPRQHRMAYVDGFYGHSVGIWISCYTKSVFLSEYRRVQQEVLLDAYAVIRMHGARLASDLIRDLREGTDPDRYAPQRPMISSQDFEEDRETVDSATMPGRDPSKNGSERRPSPEPSLTKGARTPTAAEDHEHGTMRIVSADKPSPDGTTVVTAEVIPHKPEDAVTPSSQNSGQERDVTPNIPDSVSEKDSAASVKDVAQKRQEPRPRQRASSEAKKPEPSVPASSAETGVTKPVRKPAERKTASPETTKPEPSIPTSNAETGVARPARKPAERKNSEKTVEQSPKNTAGRKQREQSVQRSASPTEAGDREKSPTNAKKKEATGSKPPRRSSDKTSETSPREGADAAGAPRPSGDSGGMKISRASDKTVDRSTKETSDAVRGGEGGTMKISRASDDNPEKARETPRRDSDPPKVSSTGGTESGSMKISRADEDSPRSPVPPTASSGPAASPVARTSGGGPDPTPSMTMDDDKTIIL